MEIKKKLYPWQRHSAKRQTKVLGVDALLYRQPDDSPTPLEYSGFSRFLFTIVDKTSEKTVTPRANIPVGDLEIIRLKTEAAVQDYFFRDRVVEAPANDLHSRPAFMQKLVSNVYKGKSPAEILIENPGEKDNLLKTRQWLAANVSKYPNNQKQIDAIDDAIQLLEIGELAGVAAPSKQSAPLYIYKTEYKHFSEKDKQGNSLVYAITITYDRTKNYPFVCEITNCFAPIEVLPDKTHRPVMSQATHTTKSAIAMSDAEWAGLVEHLVEYKRNFYLNSFRADYAKAQELDALNRRDSSVVEE